MDTVLSQINNRSMRSDSEQGTGTGKNHAQSAQAITEMTSVTQSLSSDIGEDLTSSRFEIGLISNILGQISTKIAFQAKHLSEVPAGRKNTDTQTSISLVYQF